MFTRILTCGSRPVSPDVGSGLEVSTAPEGSLERLGRRFVVSVVAEQAAHVRRLELAVPGAWRPFTARSGEVLRQLLDVVGKHRPLVQPGPDLPPLREISADAMPVPEPPRLDQRHWPQQGHQPRRLPVVGGHQVRVLVAQLSVDDRVDHRVEREVPRWRQLALERRVPEQDVQELMAQHGLDVLRRAAVFADEAEVDQQPGPLLVRHRERRHRVGELDRQDLEYRADRERVLVDQLLQQATHFEGIHA
jgi:hypothetical protein